MSHEADIEVTPQDLKNREVIVLLNMAHGDWVRPMDVGGSDGSHHSYTLRKLADMGLVEQDVRGGRQIRKAYKYRLTEKGKTVLDRVG